MQKAAPIQESDSGDLSGAENVPLCPSSQLGTSVGNHCSKGLSQDWTPGALGKGRGPGWEGVFLCPGWGGSHWAKEVHSPPL